MVTGSIITFMGIWVQIRPSEMLQNPSYLKHAFGLLLMGYGIFRFYRAYMGWKK